MCSNDRAIGIDLSPTNSNSPYRKSKTTLPLKYQFRDFYPSLFALLRSHFKINTEDYMVNSEKNSTNLCQESMSPVKYLIEFQKHSLGNFSKAKSGSFMWYSPDRKYIVKTMENHEAQTLKRMLKSYYHVRTITKLFLNIL